MRVALELLLANADVVIFDTPPLSVTDGAVLAAQVDGTLLVVRVGKVRRNTLAARREALSRVGARLLGVVLNDTPRQQDFGYYPKSVPESESVATS
jgi:Mrp family chromosome partitioning ATPase